MEIGAENPVVIAVGGSGLYLKALWEGFDDMPQINPDIRERLNSEFEKNGLNDLLNELKNADPIYYTEIDKNNTQRVIRALEVIRTSGKTFSSFRKKIKNEKR